MRITSGREGGAVRALTKFNLVTYGEVVTVWVRGDGSSTVVEVESTPMQPLVFFDLGRNLENVAVVMSGVQQAAAEAANHRR